MKPKALGKTYPLARARMLAIELVDCLYDTCHRLEIAGSVRRGTGPTVHDIDLVAWPVYNDQTAPDLFGGVSVIPGGPDQLKARLAYHQADPGNLPDEAKIIRCRFKEFPVEIFLTEHDGSNFGALYQMRTGSPQFNLQLISRANSLGLIYRAGYGLFCGDERVDDGTELGIFKALGIEYMVPELRSGATALTIVRAQTFQNKPSPCPLPEGEGKEGKENADL